MRVYVGIDDTDNAHAAYGTGKLARWFASKLPEGCHMWGVVRQQLFVHEDVPYTSHNSSACAIIDMPDVSLLDPLIRKAAEHIEEKALDGSDPGLCVAPDGHGALSRLIEFGRLCTNRVVTQRDALDAAQKVHLSAHGGTSDGIIGAAAAVGLTASGWSGRFIEFGRIRSFPDPVRVADLESSHICVVSMDRDAMVPGPNDLIHTEGWLRPRLLGHLPVLIVRPNGNSGWSSLGGKRRKGSAGSIS